MGSFATTHGHGDSCYRGNGANTGGSLAITPRAGRQAAIPGRNGRNPLANAPDRVLNSEARHELQKAAHDAPRIIPAALGQTPGGVAEIHERSRIGAPTVRAQAFARGSRGSGLCGGTKPVKIPVADRAMRPWRGPG
jgi:hypothetical protein